MVIGILAALFLLGFCVFFHELGHFLFGKWVGVRAKIFSIGFGKGRITKKIGGTTFQITAIPLGGYVQFYGDDITKKHEEIKEGDFFSVGPWKRILVALGGPVFSILLGLIVIFCLLLFDWQPPSNRVQLAGLNLPAGKVLRDGDRIIAVNEEKTQSFDEVLYHIALSPDEEIQLTVERKGHIFDAELTGKRRKDGSPLEIGIRPYGRSELIVQKTKRVNEKSSFEEGDIITSAANIPVDTMTSLRKITDANMGKEIQMSLLRKDSSLLGTSSEKEQKIEILVPVQKVRYAHFSNAVFVDETGKKQKTESLEIGPWYKEYLKYFSIAGEKYDNWEDFEKALKFHTKKNKRITVLQKNIPIEADVSFKTRGMLGLHLSEKIISEKANLKTDFISLLQNTVKQAVITTKGTLVGLVRIFQGKLSLRESVSGPIKILDYARQSVSAGWDVYWFLLANITIILGIMNLLPIPVLDGGHVLIYLIEGLYKPLPVKVIALGVRLGFTFLLVFGLYVIFIDIWDVIIKRFLN